MKVRALILHLASRPGGVTIDEAMAEGLDRRQWEQSSWMLSTTKRLHRLQVGPRKMRYFTSEADRDQFAPPRPALQLAVEPERTREPLPLSHQKPKAPARPTAGGPARLPGEPIITATTKFTYGRSPTNPIRTTTHSEAA